MSLLERVLKFGSKKPPAKQLMVEEAPAVNASIARSLLFPMSGADQLVQRLGFGVYDKMQTDAQVRSALSVKKLSVLSANWQVTAADETAASIQSANFIQFCLENMKGSINAALWNSMDALAKGFAVLEIIYEVCDKYPYEGYIVIKEIKSKDPAHFGFETDEYLNLNGLNLIVPGETPKLLPREKFIVYIYSPRYESPWGEPDLRSAYAHWFAKCALLRFYSAYLERYGSPTALGVYKRGMSPTAQSELLSALDKLQQENALIVPEDVKVELLQAMENGAAGYLNAIEHHNREISRAILGQTLATDEGKRSGSLALGNVHYNILMLQIQSLRKDLASQVVNSQIIKQLMEINFDGVPHPQFSFMAEDISTCAN